MRTQLDRARQLFQEAIALARRDPSIRRVDLARGLTDYANVLVDDGKGQEAENTLLEALATGRQADPGGLWEFQTLFTLAGFRGAVGDQMGAKAYCQQMVEVASHALGPNSADAAQAKVIWAVPASKTGELDEAARAVEEAMPILEKTYASPSLDLWVALRNASGVMRLARKYPEAEQYARKSLQLAQDAHMGQNEPRLGNSWEWLGEALCAQHKNEEGLDALRKAETIYRAAGPIWTNSAARVAKRISEVSAVH
jgi:tetratricopeptide (TPR) repeat protein